MQYTFSTDDPGEAARILEMLSGGHSHAPARRGANNDQFADDPGPEPPADDDPWADDGSRRPAQPRSGDNSRRQDNGSGGGSSVPRSGTHEVDTPKGTRYWTFGLENAPACECGLTAARQTPTERPGSKGFAWARWACPLAFSKDTYKGKCNFSQFADRN